VRLSFVSQRTNGRAHRWLQIAMTVVCVGTSALMFWGWWVCHPVTYWMAVWPLITALFTWRYQKTFSEYATMNESYRAALERQCALTRFYQERFEMAREMNNTRGADTGG